MAQRRIVTVSGTLFHKCYVWLNHTPQPKTVMRTVPFVIAKPDADCVVPELDSDIRYIVTEKVHRCWLGESSIGVFIHGERRKSLWERFVNFFISMKPDESLAEKEVIYDGLVYPYFSIRLK
jgi:hypothetical protein